MHCLVRCANKVVKKQSTTFAATSKAIQDQAVLVRMTLRAHTFQIHLFFPMIEINQISSWDSLKSAIFMWIFYLAIFFIDFPAST